MRPLFHRYNIFDVLRHQEEQLKAEVSELDERSVDAFSQEKLVHNLAAKYKLEIPILEEEKATRSNREVDVDVSDDPMRRISDRRRPFYVKGTEITIAIPFKGNGDLFDIRPQTASLNPPLGDVVRNEVRLTYTRTDNNAAALKADYERTKNEITQHLDWLQQSVATFNSQIGQKAEALLAQRKRHLMAAAEMVAAIGIPAKAVASAKPAAPISTKAITKSTGSTKKWDVFISHATEDKNAIARPLAEGLRDRDVAVWYDEFSLKLGDSLRASIDYGLANSRYGVVILSKNFFSKHWPIQELNGLASREVAGNKVILPVWHEVTADNVREFSPMMADRLGIKSDAGIAKIVDEIMKVLEED